MWHSIFLNFQGLAQLRKKKYVIKSNLCKGESTCSPHNFILMHMASLNKLNNGLFFPLLIYGGFLVFLNNHPPVFWIFIENSLRTTWCCHLSNTISFLPVSKLAMGQLGRSVSGCGSTGYCTAENDVRIVPFPQRRKDTIRKIVELECVPHLPGNLGCLPEQQ